MMNVILIFSLLCLSATSLFHVTQGNPAATTPCLPDQFTCTNSRTCIQVKYVCDGDDDCGDGEDERNCTSRGSGCGDPSLQTGSHGSLTSMYYPHNYSLNADCKWHINVASQWYILLEFVDTFDLEKPRHNQCVYDGVSVYQDDPLLFVGRFCGTSTPNPILVNSSKAIVEFQSDGQTTGHGFKLSWTAVKAPASTRANTADQCAQVIDYGGDLGHVLSPDYDIGQPYPAPLDCRWKITVDPDLVVSLNFNYMNVGVYTDLQCQHAWLDVYDGPNASSPLIGQYCDAFVPLELRSSSNTMFLQMAASDNMDGKLGFKATYYAVHKAEVDETTTTTTSGPYPPGCDGTPLRMTSDSGVVTSPFYDKVAPYRDNMDCEWALQGPPGQTFLVTFHDFDIEHSGGCEYDYLQIFDDVDYLVKPLAENGSIHTEVNIFDNDTWPSSIANLTKIVSFCGQMLPYDVETNSSRIVIKFHSDYQYGGYGFNLSYSTRYPRETLQRHAGRESSLVLCGGCVNLTSVCDGSRDCDDGSDELLCPSSTCGRPKIQPLASRIVGGQEAAVGSWPWMLSIVDLEFPGHICGATLIHPQWALSAAHCFQRVYSRNYQKFRIVAGRHQLGLPDTHEQTREVEDVLMHRQYDDPTSYNDIALIKLARPYNLTDYVQVVCLPGSGVQSGTSCYISGWGETLGTCCAGKLKQAMVPIINTTLCSSDDFYGSRLLDHMVCAGYPDGGIDSCGGDSGGPLVCETTHDDKHWEIQGITSWGLLCAAPQRPGVYTVVYDYIQWIQQNIALHH
ncbi:ovochymase-2-like [Physella acuta]|uniref:ovochymase-2-like n=1 Tax=Physella acuta TaxID=109671 RepID=UPI0027DE5B4C|nr:ovochymase-2-like [Physella acuta]